MGFLSSFGRDIKGGTGAYKDLVKERGAWVRGRVGDAPNIGSMDTGYSDPDGAYYAWAQKEKQAMQDWLNTLSPEKRAMAEQEFAKHSSDLDSVNKVGKIAALGTIGAAAGGAALTGAGVLGGGAATSGISAADAAGVLGGLPPSPGLSTGLGSLGGSSSIAGSGTIFSPGFGGTGAGLGVPGLSTAASPYSLLPSTVKTGMDTGSLLTGLGQYGPLISAGLGVANSIWGGPKMPSTPNYQSLLTQQTAAQNALYDKQIQDSRVNTTGPGGSQTWQKGPDGQWTLATTLDPAQQGLYDAQMAMSQGLIKNAQTATQGPLDFSSAPGLMSGALNAQGNPQYLQSMADALYSKNTRYLDPQMEQDQRALESRLGEQGFVPGTPAYNQAMTNFMDTKNRAYGSARDYATTQGFTSGLANAQFNNQARAQSIGEILAQRNQPLNELNAFKTGNQVQTPQGSAQYSTPQQQSPDVIGANTQGYNAALGQYNAGTAQTNNTTNNLFGLAGLLMNGQYNNGMYSPNGGKYNLWSGLGKGP